MAERVVAADASPLIGLASAGAFDVLERLFGRVVVTHTVRDEVLAGGVLPGAAELLAAMHDGWIVVVEASAAPAEFPELGAGEASTLGYALTCGGNCLVVMDDPLGRARAQALGQPLTGLAGVLLEAKRAGAVTSVRPYLDRLATSNFRLSKEIVRAVLEEAGEAGSPSSS
jgi:predicted nucleic acid-binding protein